MTDYDMIIIGSGPAGLTAAIYGARASLNVLVLEGMQPGGQLTTTTDIENFPGFPEGIQGSLLMNHMREQAKRFGAETRFDQVTALSTESSPYTVSVGETTYTTKTIILATGARSRMLGLESEKKLFAKGVSTCATCDGFFFKDKEIAVIGGGDSAMEEATFLTKFASKVTILNRSERFRASPIMLERAKKNPKIQFLTNVIVDEFLGDDKLTAIRLENVLDKSKQDLPVDGAFLAIGHIPNTDLVKNILEFDELGFIKTVSGTATTNVHGLFACGDVQDRNYRQAITAAGSGCKAAMEAQKYIEHHHE